MMEKSITATIISDSIKNPEYFIFPVSNHKGFHYLEAYITVLYYICCLPFRLKFNKEKQSFEILQSGLQKIFCVLGYLFYISYSFLCHSIRFTNTSFGKTGTNDHWRFFLCTETLIELSYVIVLTYTVFCKLNKVQCLIETIQEKYSFVPFNRKVFNLNSEKSS